MTLIAILILFAAYTNNRTEYPVNVVGPFGTVTQQVTWTWLRNDLNVCPKLSLAKCKITRTDVSICVFTMLNFTGCKQTCWYICCIQITTNSDYSQIIPWRTSTGFLLPISHNLPAHARAGAATFTKMLNSISLSDPASNLKERTFSDFCIIYFKKLKKSLLMCKKNKLNI